MSTNRTSSGGWCNPAALPRGPNGRALCRRCNVEVPKGRKSFCGQACVDEWSVRTNPGYARRKVKERDHGVCAQCGVDCEAIRNELRALRKRCWAERYGEPENPMATWWERSVLEKRQQAERYAAFEARCDELGLSEKRRQDLTKSFWEADHIVPVVEGGGECGLENLQTLCWKCHSSKTVEMRIRRGKSGVRWPRCEGCTHRQEAKQ